MASQTTTDIATIRTAYDQQGAGAVLQVSKDGSSLMMRVDMYESRESAQRDLDGARRGQWIVTRQDGTELLQQLRRYPNGRKYRTLLAGLEWHAIHQGEV